MLAHTICLKRVFRNLFAFAHPHSGLHTRQQLGHAGKGDVEIKVYVAS